MAGKKLDQSTVDVTFNAFWDQTKRSPAGIDWALKKTIDQIQGGMPPSYVPPPRRKLAQLKTRMNSKGRVTVDDAKRAMPYRPIGLKRLEADLTKMVATMYPELPPSVGRQILMLGCPVDPKAYESRVHAIIKQNWSKIEAYNRKGPVASQGPKRDIDQEYAQRDAKRKAVAAMQKRSIMFSGPKGKQLAEQVLANKHAMMLLDQQYLSQNSLASGFYGMARAFGADHDSAMKIGQVSQNILEVTAGFGGMNPYGGYQAPINNRPNIHSPMGSGRPGQFKVGNYFRESGIPKPHFEVFRSAARTEKRVALVRPTKAASMQLIEKGAPAKGMDLSKAGIKCSPQTGVATTNGKGQAQAARKLGYFVVDADGVARDAAGNKLQFKGKPIWSPKPGQVVDGKSQKPVVGDYDLLDVIDPGAMGRRLVLASSNKKTLPDQTNPMVRAFRDAVNRKLDQPRTLHGAHADFSGLPNEGAVAFLPNGNVVFLPNQQSVKAFYQMIGRPTRVGKHGPKGVTVGVE